MLQLSKKSNFQITNKSQIRGFFNDISLITNASEVKFHRVMNVM